MFIALTGILVGLAGLVYVCCAKVVPPVPSEEERLRNMQRTPWGLE